MWVSYSYAKNVQSTNFLLAGAMVNLVPSSVVTCFGKVVEFACTLDGSNEYWSVSSTCGTQNYTNMSSFNLPLSSVNNNNITIISFKNDSIE